MYACILEGDTLRETSAVADIQAAVAAKRPVWIELEKQSAEADALLADLGIHPLTIEDIWATRGAPKLDDYPGYLYVIVHAVAPAKEGKLETVELDVIVGSSFVITHDPGGVVSEQLRAELRRQCRVLAKGPAWFAHEVLDRAVDLYLPVVDRIDADIESLETEVLAAAGTRRGPTVLRRILRFKRVLQELRRTSVHQREILLRLARGEFDEIPADAVPFYRDVYDHFLRFSDLVESYRDLVTGALEAYLSVQSNRMNENMKTLTLISTVMLPVTFIAGVYGMNFKVIPELDWKYGYAYVLGLMAVVTIGILAWFRHRGWLFSDDDGGGAED
jgi:magnesium transporter